MTPKTDTLDAIRRLSNSHNITSNDIYRGHTNIVLSITEPPQSPFDEDYLTSKWNKITGGNGHNSTIAAVDREKTFLEGDNLVITCYPSCYRDYKVTLDHPSVRVWLTGATGFARFIHRKEPYYLFGKRKSKTNNIGGSIELLPGGFVDVATLKFKDPYQSTIRREYVEETGMPENTIKKLTPLDACFVRDGNSENPYQFQDMTQAFLIDLEEGITPKNVQNWFEDNPISREHTRIEIIPHSKLVDFTSKNIARLSIVSRFKLEQFLKKY